MILGAQFTKVKYFLVRATVALCRARQIPAGFGGTRRVGGDVVAADRRRHRRVLQTSSLQRHF